MAENNAAPPRRVRAIALHLGFVGLSFVLSIGILSGVHLMPGEVLEFLAIGTVVIHAAAAVAALFPRRATLRSCAVIFGFAFLPAGCEGVSRVREAYRMRYVLPGDRFRDHVASPVPASVTNLRFVPLAESGRPDLMFRFDIAPADLDEILARHGFRRVTPGELLRHDDLFRDPAYLRMGEGDELFQARDEWGQVMVMKVNGTHTRAIFRRG